MPIYEFVCKDCKEHFEVLTTSSSPNAIKCKKCGSLNVKKTISASSFRMGHGGTSIPSGALSGCSPKSGFS
ncbi:MAG: zinc ribbon domain-containing protein [Desulfobulbaceae bacterium]|nr:zinc ribbon domain-containing protein [Desulfobulbaceae bacterium]